MGLNSAFWVDKLHLPPASPVHGPPSQPHRASFRHPVLLSRVDGVYAEYKESKELAGDLVQDPGMGLDDMLGWRCKLANCIHSSWHAEQAESYLELADTLHKEGLKSTAGGSCLGLGGRGGGSWSVVLRCWGGCWLSTS